MVRTGSYAYAAYGWEDGDDPDVFAGTATVNKSFGLRTAVSGWTLNTSKMALHKLGQVEASEYAYGKQTGTLGIGFVLGDKTSHELFRSILNTAASGNGSIGQPYLYGSSTGAQGSAAKTWIGNTFTTEIGFNGETEYLIRTLKGCIMNTLNISASVGNVVECSADIVYGKEDAPSNSSGDFTGVPTEESKPFTFAHGSLKLGGDIIAEIQSCDISFAQNGELLYQLGSNQAVTAIKRKLEITGRFQASWKDDNMIDALIAQLKGTGYKETYGDVDTDAPEFELNFTNGLAGSAERIIKITGYDLGLTDHSVTGIEPAEPVFEEINWQLKTVKVQAANL